MNYTSMHVPKVKQFIQFGTNDEHFMQVAFSL